ncbi:SARP family transcriptional regulator [Actinoplanes sp. N902-109]|nr:SARP family transcriptional regulator [Actinoplanes sp. N902-109]
MLGPVQVLSARGAVDPGPARQRCVLAALAVDAGRPVPVPALIDRVWDDRPPQRARHTLQVHLSRLRTVLAAADPAARIVRRCGGYTLDLAAGHSDMGTVQALVRQARHPGTGLAEQGATLDRALQLWQGTPLAGLPGQWVEQVRQHWLHLRLDLLIRWAAAHLATGRVDAVLAGSSAALIDFPLAEPLWAVRMRALVAAQRRAEALALYESARRRLATELGVDPGPELAALHHALLT